VLIDRIVAGCPVPGQGGVDDRLVFENDLLEIIRPEITLLTDKLLAELQIDL